MKARMIRFAAASVTALGFIAPGVAGAHGNTIDTTGPKSHNKIEKKVDNKVNIDTDNKVNIANYNDQFAKSGYADVRDNAKVGNVKTGDAVNSNETRANVHISTKNSLPTRDGDNTIRYTGPESHNEIKKEVRNDIRIDTDNRVDIHNDSRQVAISGDAIVHNNTKVGDVRTGDAVNQNTSHFNVTIETVNN